MDLLYDWGDRILGLELVTPLVVLGSLLMVVSIALRVFRAVPKPLPAAIGVVWVMWLLIGYFTPRPVLASLVLLAIFVLVVDTTSLRWAIPLVLWLWAGVHGGFIVGIGYLALDGLRRKDPRRLADISFGAVATLLTAHGWATWQILFDFLGSSSVLDLIAEWHTPNFISVALFPFALAIVALIVAGMKGWLKTSDLWVVVPFVLFAFTANRSVPLAALCLAPYFVQTLAPMKVVGRNAKGLQSSVNSFVLAAVLIVPWLLPLDGGLDQELFGVNALRFVDPGPLFHDDAVGGYLIYSEWPDRHVYIDDRAELYGDTFVEFVRTRGGQAGWREVFDRYQIHQALLKLDEPLVQVLIMEGWIEGFRDEGFVVLTNPIPREVS